MDHAAQLSRAFGAQQVGDIMRGIHERCVEYGSDSDGYVDYLKGKHDAALNAVGASGKKFYDYVYSSDGFAATLTANQANALAVRKDVRLITPDTRHEVDTSSTPAFLGLSAPGGLWDQLGGVGSAGEGVIVGIVDGGIWPESLSFSDRTGANGNATKYGKLVADNTSDFVHSSHCLEHLVNPETGLGHWLRIVKPGGFVIVTIPDEDLYEQGVWPSTYNSDHKQTFTTFKVQSWSPRSVSVLPMLCTMRPPVQVVKVEQLLAKYDWRGGRRDLTWLTDAECAIEIVLRKPIEQDLARGGRAA